LTRRAKHRHDDIIETSLVHPRGKLRRGFWTQRALRTFSFNLDFVGAGSPPIKPAEVAAPVHHAPVGRRCFGLSKFKLTRRAKHLYIAIIERV
jgi:hypothetical protein